MDLNNLRARSWDYVKQNYRAFQLEKYLDSFEIENAKIGGIGKGRKQILRVVRD